MRERGVVDDVDAVRAAFDEFPDGLVADSACEDDRRERRVALVGQFPPPGQKFEGNLPERSVPCFRDGPYACIGHVIVLPGRPR